MGFALGVAEQIGWYVYLLVDPRSDAVFYVGKGTGDRCFAHVHEARKTEADTMAEYEKLARIREIESNGRAVDIQILRHGLTERESFLIEAASIELLGLGNLSNRVPGHGARLTKMSVEHLNTLYARSPVVLDPEHSVMLPRIQISYERQMNSDAIYETTRRSWRVSPHRRQVGKPGAPVWAMGIVNGNVRGVYRVEAWEPAGAEAIAEEPNRAGRWGFIGHADAEMESIYLNADVSAYMKSQSALQFFPRKVD